MRLLHPSPLAAPDAIRYYAIDTVRSESRHRERDAINATCNVKNLNAVNSSARWGRSERKVLEL